MIKIDFTKTDGTYTLQDAIHLPEDHKLTDVEIDAIQQERFDNWVAIITAPEVPTEIMEEAPVDTTVARE